MPREPAHNQPAGNQLASIRTQVMSPRLPRSAVGGSTTRRELVASSGRRPGPAGLGVDVTEADAVVREREIVVLKADRTSLQQTFKDAGIESVRLIEPN